MDAKKQLGKDVFLRFVSRIFFVKSDVLDENGSKKCCLVFLKILDLENDPS